MGTDAEAGLFEGIDMLVPKGAADLHSRLYVPCNQLQVQSKGVHKLHVP